MKKYVVCIFTILIFIVIGAFCYEIMAYYGGNLSFFNRKNENIAENIVQDIAIENSLEDLTIEGKYDHDEYQEKIDSVAEKYGAIGVSIALVENGKNIDYFSYGSAIKGKMDMSENMKIRIASVSKVFVGIATMISIEDGTMSLDEDIGNYWGFKIGTHNKDDVITPRNLLTHTSSLYGTEEVSATYYSAMANRLKSGKGIRNIVSGNIENYMYNNYAIDVLGMTIEIANEKNIDDILNERIYEDLDIDSAFYGGDIEDKENIATIYQEKGKVGLSASRVKNWHRKKYGTEGWAFAGGVTISTKDLGKIVAILSNDGVYDGKRYLSEESIDNIEYHEGNNTGEFWQCQPLCYQEDTLGQEKLYYHHGMAYGLSSMIGYNPDTKQGVAIVTTGASGEEEICDELANILLNIEI